MNIADLRATLTVAMSETGAGKLASELATINNRIESTKQALQDAKKSSGKDFIDATSALEGMRQLRDFITQNIDSVTKLAAAIKGLGANASVPQKNTLLMSTDALREQLALLTKLQNTITKSPGDTGKLNVLSDKMLADAEKWLGIQKAVSTQQRLIDEQQSRSSAFANGYANALDKLKGAASSAMQAVSNGYANAGNWLTALGSAAQFASGPIGNLMSRILSLGNLLQSGMGIGIAVAGMSTLVAMFAKFGKEAIRVESYLGPIRSLHNALANVAGEDSKKNWNDLIGIMDKYGLSLENMSRPIARLKIATEGTLLGGEKFKAFVEDFAAIGTRFALPQEAMARMAKAYEQMISKGTVQAEEFRQQLGDALPAAARAGSEAYRRMMSEGTVNAEKYNAAFDKMKEKLGGTLSDGSIRFRIFKDAMKDGAIESVNFLQKFQSVMKEMFGVQTNRSDSLVASYGRLKLQFDLFIDRMNQGSGFTRIWSSALNGLASAFSGATIGGTALVAVLGGTLAVALLSVTAKLTSMAVMSFAPAIASATIFGTSMSTLGGKIAGAASKLLIFAAAAAAIAYFSSPAKAAEISMDGLKSRIEATSAQLDAQKDKFVAWADVGALTDDIRMRMELYKGTLSTVRLEIDKLGANGLGEFASKSIEELKAMREAAVGSGSVNEAFSRLGETLRGGVGANDKLDLAIRFKEAQESVGYLQEKLDKLTDAQKRLNQEVNTGYAEDDKANGKITKFEKISDAIDAAREKLRLMRTEGIEAANLFSNVETLKRQYGVGKENGATEAQARELANLNQLIQLESTRTKNAVNYQAIIERGDALIEGAGLKEANFLKQMIKQQEEYTKALVATGMAAEEAAARASQLRAALEMKQAGVNLDNLQYKPFAALQKGLESFADKSAELLVNGQMNAKNFKEAFNSMALSISKDIVAMILKVTVLKPLMQGLFGGVGGDDGGGGFGSFLSGLFGFGSPKAFAKGGIVDSPEYFPMGGGGVGLRGEAGAEAILPLRRGPDGTMGVTVNGGGGGMGSFQPVINIYNPTADSVSALQKQIPEAIVSAVMDMKKRKMI